MIYFRLFLSFIQIGLFGFGGGYAAMPLLQGVLASLRPAVVAMIAASGVLILSGTL